jgi:hypothetical protein
MRVAFVQQVKSVQNYLLSLKKANLNSMLVLLAFTAALPLFSQTASQPLASRSQAQTSGSAADGASNHPIPLHHKYRYFLIYERKLDQKADALELQGHSDEAALVRLHLQKDLRFTDEQIATVREAGIELKSDLDAIKSQAQPVLSEDRKWKKLNGRSAGPPPGAEQIHALQAQQETVIKDAVTHLNRQLGPEPAARLQTYVDAHVIGNTKHISSHKPKIGTPFHLEAQQ